MSVFAVQSADIGTLTLETPAVRDRGNRGVVVGFPEVDQFQKYLREQDGWGFQWLWRHDLLPFDINNSPTANGTIGMWNVFRIYCWKTWRDWKNKRERKVQERTSGQRNPRLDMPFRDHR